MKKYFVLLALCVSVLCAQKSEVSFSSKFDEMKELKEVYIGVNHSRYNEKEKKCGDMSLYIFNKSSKKATQQIDVYSDVYDKRCLDSNMEIEDYNFDDYEDIQILADNLYYLYDPKKSEFFLSERIAGYLKFDFKYKTATRSEQININGNSFAIDTTYKIVKNEMIEIDRKCYLFLDFESHAKVNVDCNSISDIRIYILQSVKQKKNFTLELAILDEKKAVVLYKGQKEYINLEFKGDDGEEGLAYNEIVKGEITGTYIIYDSGSASYIRAKDDKRFEFESIKQK
jgi:hypothetical protein